MTKSLTTGNPAKLIFFFTIPLLVGNIFQQVYNMADTLIVGRTIGVKALAAVGCTGSLMFLIIGFAMGLTAGFSIITAQRFGAKDEDSVKKSFAVSILLSALVTVFLTLFSVILARPILHWMQTPPEIVDDAYKYIVIIYGGIGSAMMFNLLSNVIRALGDSKTPLLFLIIACVLNIILDFTLIRAFSLGVAGAAIATVISQIVSGIMCILYIRKKLPILHLRKGDWKPSHGNLWQHLRIGLPMAFQASIIAIGAIILQFALNGLGATSVAAYTAAQKIDMVATLPMMSFGITMATYVAQNYGAGNIDRIRQGVRQCSFMSILFALGVGLLNITAGHWMISLFVGEGEPKVISLAQIYLNINGSAYCILSLLFIYRYTLQGLGQSVIPTFAGVMELLMRTLAALALTAPLGFAGASMSNPLAWLGACIPLGIAYFYTMKKLERQQPPVPVKKEAVQTNALLSPQVSASCALHDLTGVSSHHYCMNAIPAHPESQTGVITEKPGPFSLEKQRGFRDKCLHYFYSNLKPADNPS